jgi:hypothetical protein
MSGDSEGRVRAASRIRRAYDPNVLPIDIVRLPAKESLMEKEGEGSYRVGTC